MTIIDAYTFGGTFAVFPYAQILKKKLQKSPQAYTLK